MILFLALSPWQETLGKSAVRVQWNSLSEGRSLPDVS